MKQLLFYATFSVAMLFVFHPSEANAQSTKDELHTYLQQLEVEKLQYQNNPARYKEYENKIADITEQLKPKNAEVNTPISVSNVRLRDSQASIPAPVAVSTPVAPPKSEREVQLAILKDLKSKYEELKQSPASNCRACSSIEEMALEIARLEEILK